MFADKAELFNRLVQHVCTLVDHRLDCAPRRCPSRSRLRRASSDVGHTLLHSTSHARVRRCDSQHITEEEPAPSYTELASPLTNDDESRPVFVVAEEELS